MSRKPNFSEPSTCLSVRVPKSKASLIRKMITAIAAALDTHPQDGLALVSRDRVTPLIEEGAMCGNIRYRSGMLSEPPVQPPDGPTKQDIE